MPLHKPVMAREAVEALAPEDGDIIVDCTVGCGGHARLILEKIGPKGRLIGIDIDDHALDEAKKNLAGFGPASYILKKSNFGDIDKALEELGIAKIDGALFDLGVSSLQLDEAGRGFSMQEDGPLDMRMDPGQGLSAADIVNRADEESLCRIIREYGEERYASRIARFIVGERKIRKITRTRELAEVVKKAVGGRYGRQKIHPATRTFQGIRIAVNDELERLKEGLEKATRFLESGARICVISFHSLEDRIVKNFFKERARTGALKIVTKKPLRPGEEEKRENPRSRSAKLRVAEAAQK